MKCVQMMRWLLFSKAILVFLVLIFVYIRFIRLFLSFIVYILLHLLFHLLFHLLSISLPSKLTNKLVLSGFSSQAYEFWQPRCAHAPKICPGRLCCPCLSPPFLSFFKTLLCIFNPFSPWRNIAGSKGLLASTLAGSADVHVIITTTSLALFTVTFRNKLASFKLNF